MIHPTDDPQILLVDEAEGTRNPAGKCSVHYAAIAVFRYGRFEITQLPGQGRPGPTGSSCAALAIAGPFYATVHLSVPYRGQPLVDAADGQVHAPLALVKLADAPARFR